MRFKSVTVRRRDVWIIIGRSVPRAYLSYFFSPQLWFIWFLSSARGFWTITRGSKVSSSRTGLEKKFVTSQLPGLSARRFKRCSPTYVNEAINLNLCLMSSSVSAPFSMARKSVYCGLFVLPMGMSARNNRTLRSPKRWWFSGFEARPLALLFLELFRHA